MEVAESIDTGMETGGSLEAFVTAIGAHPTAELADRNPALVARAKDVTRRGVPGWVFPFALSPLLFALGAMLLGGVVTGYRFLPTPDQPTPPCVTLIPMYRPHSCNPVSNPSSNSSALRP